MSESFLKWAGGKRWLASSGHLPIPTSYTRYVEPFLGGGAVFFHLKPHNALLSDLNSELICLYEVMRDDPDALYDVMSRHEEYHSKDYYYQIRGFTPRSQVQIAARFLYLNRTCWNGLYRVNLKGKFNVPIGTKDSVIFDDDDFWTISTLLKQAEIRRSDFEPIIDSCKKGDFLFVDPPYTVQHNLNGFLKYNEKIFSWDDQIRLRNAVERAIEREVSIVVTNADHKSIRDLYRDVCNYQQIGRYSKLAGDSSKRGKTSEALFTANISNE